MNRKLLLFSLFFQVVFCVKAYSQSPVANFSSNVVSGCVPVIVKFTDLSTNNPTSWNWDLGNGSIATIKNPVTTYINPGVYTIKLTATNSSGSGTEVKTGFITINALPLPDFSSVDTVSCVPAQVRFQDQSIAGSGTISQWEWNFGNGVTSTSQDPVYVYNNSGVYGISLKITNSNGCVKAISKSAYIKVGLPISPDFSYSINSGCRFPINVSFNNQTPGQNMQHTWLFGNGQTSTLPNPVVAYAAAGTYTVWMVSSSPDGCIDSISKTVTLTTKTTSFTASDSLCVGTQGTFVVQSTPTPLSILWKMGDGATYNSATVSHTYATVGNYTITLVNGFGGCLDSLKKVISIKPLPVADFSSIVTSGCKVPFPVSFNNLSTGAVTRLWTFGDGATSTLANPTHTYTGYGTYGVNLSVVSSSGCTSSFNKPDFIKIEKPSITVSNASVSQCLPYDFTPAYSISTSDPVVSYNWGFGDGGTSTLPNPTHTYTVQGNYTLTVVIITAGGCKDSLVIPNAIKVGLPINLDFTPIPLASCAGDFIHFVPFTNNLMVQSYNWNFGDMVTSTLEDPTHKYRDTGRFTVSLDVVNNGCKSSVVKNQVVQIGGSVSAFSFTRNCSVQGEMEFTNLSINADSMRWDFGDGATSNAISPIHNYTTAGNYTVSLIAVNGACADTFYQLVPIWFGAISASTPTPLICKNDRIFFDMVHPNPAYVSNYNWNFSGNIADGFISSAAPQVAINYFKTGHFGFIGITEDIFGCRDTITISQMVRSNGPTPNFDVNITNACTGTKVTFSDSSTSDGVNNLQQWQWDFGDGTIQNFTSAPFEHTYTTAGSFNVQLTITDSSGCSESIIKNNLVNITLAKANFSTTDTITCQGKNVSFANSSLGSNLMYTWSFGDGTTSALDNPNHTYQSNGSYTIQLIAYGSSGCSDTLTKSNYVKVDMPRAAFTASDTVSNCPPAQIIFTDGSHFADTWLWSFDDGNSSSAQNPSNLFFDIKDYRVKLIVTSPGGCIDTVSKVIKVNGPNGTFNYSPTVGCGPFQVNFNVQTTSAVNFTWDFGDGVNLTSNNASVSHTYTSGGKFLPTVFIGDINGCFIPIYGTDTITTEALLIGFDADKKLMCDSGIVAFTNQSQAFGPIWYTWHFGDGDTSTLRNPVHTYANVGSYNVKLVAFSPLGCSDSITKMEFVKVVKSPSVSILADSFACFNNVIFNSLLAPDSSTIISTLWTFGNGQTSNLLQPPVQNFSTGNYINKLVVTNSSGCTDSTSKAMQVLSYPVVQITTDTTICQGSSFNLMASGGINYTWQSPMPTSLSCTNCANPIATPLVNTKYKVTVSNQACSLEDSVFIKLFLKPTFKVIADQTICAGNSVQLNASGTQRFMWSPPTGLSQVAIPNPVAAPASTTIYTAIGFDTLGCFVDSGFVAVTVVPLPIVELGPDVLLAAGNSHTFLPVYSSDVDTYIWSPPTNLSCTNCPNPATTARDNITYRIQVKNNVGCYSTDSVKVIVACDGSSVFIPNTFSPNGDGMNDLFFPRGKGIYKVKSIMIFNRWGLPVYEKRDLQPNDAATAWNGTYKGSKQPAGTYTYVVEIICTSRQILKFYGTIQLIQ